MTSSKPISKFLATGNEAPLFHGGDLEAVRAQFPHAPEPFVDLSTGVNPHAYPITADTVEGLRALPDPAGLARLLSAAARFYNAPSTDNMVAAPGSQILMALIADLMPRGRVAILGPTYAEHERVTKLAGHDVKYFPSLGAVNDPRDLAFVVVVNPNNPDGRIVAKEDLLEITARQKNRGGLLVVDEAFMDAGPLGESVASCVEDSPVVVLRSFGKFFGLAGLRLSFAVANRGLASRLRARLGPWPVSGPALSVGAKAFGDEAWVGATRARLASDSARLAALLGGAPVTLIGQTNYFCLVSSPKSHELFDALGGAGLFVRQFEENEDLLRFGLPGKEEEWQRLKGVLKAR